MAQDRPPPPPASIRFCDARRQAYRPRIGPRSMLCGPARTMDASVSSPLAATMPTTRASSQSMLLSSMISESWCPMDSEINKMRQQKITTVMLAPTEQPLDVGELQFHVGRAAVIALAGIGRPLHLAQQRIHLGR